MAPMIRLARAAACLAALLSSALFASPAPAQPARPDAGPESQTLLRSESPFEQIPASQFFAPLPERRIDKDKPVPAGYRRERVHEEALVAGGASLLAFSYGLAVVLARAEPAALATPALLANDPALDRPLYAPLVGPLVALSQGERSAASRAIVGLDGLGQLAGLGLLCAGLAVRRDVLVPIDEKPAALAIGPGFIAVRGAF